MPPGGRGTLVDDGEARLNCGAVPDVDRAVDGRREDDGPALLQAHEVVPPGRAIRREARLRDGDEATALRKARQRGRHMPQRRVRAAPVDIGERRERRVHQNDGGGGAGTEVVVDPGRVEARDTDIREEMAEEAGARVGELVQDERGAGKLGEDREEARAGRRLQHLIARRNRGRSGRHERQGERRGELLEGLALLRASPMAREQVGDLDQHRQQGGGRPGTRAHRAAKPAQEQDGRGLAGVVGALPVPRATGIAAAAGLLHRGTEHGGIDPLPAFDVCDQQLGSAEERSRTIGGFGQAGARCRHHGGGGGCRRHEGTSEVGGGWGRSRRLSLDRAGSARSGCPSRSRVGCLRLWRLKAARQEAPPAVQGARRVLPGRARASPRRSAIPPRRCAACAPRHRRGRRAGPRSRPRRSMPAGKRCRPAAAAAPAASRCPPAAARPRVPCRPS